MPLYVNAVGAVSAAGIGAENLTKCCPPAEKEMALASSPNRSFRVFLVDRSDPRWNTWMMEPRLRRAGAMAQFFAEAVRQVVENVPEQEKSRIGLIAIFNNGSIGHTVRFVAGYRGQGRRFASPLLFPETVYNAATSHAAAVFGLGGPCSTLVGDESAWIDGIRMARVWLRLGHVSTALVVAAEELTPVTLDAYYSARWLRRKRPFRPAEGSAALLLTAHSHQALFEVQEAPTNLPYRNRQELVRLASALAADLPPNVPAYRTAQASWLGSIERAALRDISLLDPYPYLGEAWAVSAGWHTIRAASLLSERRTEILLPIWGTTHQLSWLQLRRIGSTAGRADASTASAERIEATKTAPSSPFHERGS
ncbi:beta-ketoacyl synthase N-terminal-like domain-containing protein [Methylacidimicrobium cyclopophantes]|uniref:beta-ketoacyl synthase N-terminal-like domain-containing protein n=1 Tax=Methylacidimicrobium cyclopophantes TaxID=1041766 RepID=UPI0015B5CF10|nr:beta-ketoacyl synthase N-terminal-like domain-containing protein [Methylacidimicrobium cyclopophantes]